jgi:hypothetical protein
MGNFEKRLHTKLQQLNSFITSIGTTYAEPLSVETLGKLGSSQDGHKHVDTLSDLLAGILADDHPNHPVRQTIKDFLSKLVDHVRNMAHSPTAEIHSKPTFTFGGLGIMIFTG